MDAALQRPSVEIGDVVRGEADGLDLEHAAPSLVARLWIASNNTRKEAFPPQAAEELSVDSPQLAQ
ncbi:hypothetical protein GCM10023087_27000 [Microbacterium rhizosphaerae]